MVIPKYELPWKEEEKPRLKIEESKPSLKKWFVVFLIFFFLVLAAAGIWLYFYYQNSLISQGVGIEFSGNNKVYLGQNFKLTVNYFNNSNFIFKDAVLSLMLPDGVSFLGEDVGKKVKEISLGDLGPGSISNQSYDLIALSGPQSVKSIQAALDYTSFQTISNRFEKKTSIDIQIQEPIIDLTINSPQNIISGENFDLMINYKNNSNQPTPPFALTLNYPSVYRFGKSSVPPQSGNNVWNFNSLNPNESGNLTITGSVLGAEKSFFDISADLSVQYAGQSYDINSQKMQLLISSSPLSLGIAVNGAASYITQPGDNLNYVLTYKNNSDIILQNVVITATLTGGLYDFSQFQTNAFFNGINNTFIWNQANTADLASLSPGQTGGVNLTISLKKNYPIGRISDKNFTLKVDSRIESPTTLPNSNTSKTVGLASLEIPVQGRVQIQAKGLFRDASSGILNDGPFPPKVNQPTDYTIHWIITNYATDVSNINVQAVLPSGISWAGVVKSTISAQPTFDANSNSVFWKISSLPATTGIIAPPAEAIFQIKALPSNNQVGDFELLLGQTTIQANDNFVNVQLSDSAKEINTSLPDDPTVSQTEGKVQP